MTDEGANASGPDNDGGSSTASAGSNGKEPRPDDKAKRRSKNRVNARRSRERKRLMMDTLQQEHWKLHVENKRIIMDNDKLRQAIATIKALRGKGNTVVSVGKGAPPADTTFPSDLAHQGIANVPTSNSQEGSSETGSSMQQPNVAAGNPLLTMWLQQVFLQQQAAGGTPGGMNPILMQLLVAQALQQQSQIPQVGFNPLLNTTGGMGVGYNSLMHALGPMGGMTLSLTAQPGNLQQNTSSSMGNTTTPGPQPHYSHTTKDESSNAPDINDKCIIGSQAEAGGASNLAAI